MKKLSLTVCTVLFFLCSFANAQRLTVKVASVAPTRSPWDVEQKNLAQEWAKKTGNSVTIQFYDTVSLGGEEEVIRKLRAVRPGQKPPLDGAVFTNIGAHMLAPQTKIMTFIAPFMFRNQDEVNYVLDKSSPMLEKALKDEGYVLLGRFSVGWIHFMTRKEVRTPEALKEVSLALGGVGSIDLTNTFKQAGFKTENVPADKLSQSIKSPGGVQGVFTIPMYGYATRFYESLPFIIDVPICPIFSLFVVSERTWSQAPDQYKSQLLDATRASEDVFIKVQKESDRSNLDLMAKNGATLVKLTPAELAHWEQVFASDVQRIADSGKSVIDGPFLAEIQKLLDNYRATHNSVRN